MSHTHLTRVRALLRPHREVRGVIELDPAELKLAGIEALILDVDNTLVTWHSTEIGPDVLQWVAEARAAGLRLCLLSNTRRAPRLRDLAALLEVDYVLPGGKPGRAGFLRAMERLGTHAANTAVVGDQLLTDVFGGNRCGLRTFLVQPLSPREFWGTRWISRSIERLVLRRTAALPAAVSSDSPAGWPQDG